MDHNRQLYKDECMSELRKCNVMMCRRGHSASPSHARERGTASEPPVTCENESCVNLQNVTSVHEVVRVVA